jgi:hypothetical protein
MCFVGQSNGLPTFLQTLQLSPCGLMKLENESTTIQANTNEPNNHSSKHQRTKQPFKQTPTNQTTIKANTNEPNNHSSKHQRTKQPLKQPPANQKANGRDFHKVPVDVLGRFSHSCRPNALLGCETLTPAVCC